ncbi:proline-rich extensin-like protein EPR1 isoform X5 [Perca fluviatilis]|uniref:proline-rich extensin-like protein EPR1 isoform X5 n=1 Tax=Perca fluviatilis TaxID=8168 RepID=UPI0019622F45|nr:proline-rich extensin-like protein EPR1 isoform X5 [Perca fluviatilis]
MAYRESRGSRILLSLGLLVFASSFCRCAKLKALDKLRENSTLGEGQAKAGDLCYGRLLIGQNSLPDDKLNRTKATKNFLDVDTDYQEDMGWGNPEQLQRLGYGFSKPDNAAVERLLLMDPKVECTGDSMKLQVQNAASTPGSLFFVDRGSRMSPLALSKLPPSCGYTIRSTRRDLVLVAPYDGCFVVLEEDSYVLPIRWLGLNVRMSCPLMQSSPNPPMVTCHAEGMVVKTGWTVSIAEININLNGNWEPLMKASSRCGFSVVVHPEGVVISVHYTPCMEKKDGMYTLELAGEGETKMSCPALPWPPASGAPQQQPFYLQPETEKPTADPRPLQTKAPQGKLQPPFYLYPFYPQPVTEKPTAEPRPPQTKAPQGQVQPPFYPQPETEKPTAAPRPPQTEAPQGQVRLPFYPYPFYPQPVTEKPIAAPRPPQTEAPQGKVQPPFYPQPETEKPTAAPRPPQTEAPQGQVRLPFYPYPFYPQPVTEKPIAAPRPPQTEAPQGQVQPPFYPFYPQLATVKQTADPRPLQTEAPEAKVQPPFYPQPETEKPTAAPRPPQTKAPQGQVQPQFYPYPFYPQPVTEKPTAAPRPPQTEAPQGQVRLPFYPYPFYPQPVTEKPTAAPRPPQTEAPEGKVQPPFYPQPETEKPTAAPRPPQTKAPQGKVQPPFYPQPETEKPTAAPRPPQTEAPQGQVQPQFYLYPFYPQPVTEKPTAAPRPPQTEAPQGRVQLPFYPYPFYPQPVTEKPTAAPRPPQTEAPQGQVRLPFYPYPFYPQPVTEKPTAAPRPPQTEAPEGKVQPPFYPQPETEKPTAAPRPPQTKAPQGKVQPPFYLYPFYPQPETVKPVMSTPATTMQQPQQVITLTSEQPPLESGFSQPSNSDVVPQGPQQGSPYMQPVACPQFCLSGISNCCPQIAFHQHHHHIIPSGLGSKDAPSLYPGLPFPQLAYSEFHSSLGSGPLPQKPTKTMMMQATPTATTAQSQYLSSGNEKQPPDGNPAILNYPSKPGSFEQPLYPFVPNSLYPYWPYIPQNEALQRLPQNQSPAHYNVHSKRHTPGSEPVNPVLQYERSPMQQNGQLAWDINNSSGPDFMSHIGKYLHQQHMAKQQNAPKARELQQSNEASKSRLMHPKVKSETDRPLVPYDMLQDAKAQTYEKLMTPNNASQPEHKQTVHSYLEPKSYVLLQHGPPGRKSNYSSESPLPSRDLVYDADLKAHNLARHHSSKLQDPQNVKPPQENSQHPKMLEKVMSHPLPDVNYIPRPDDEPSLPFISLDDPHSVPLPQDPFVNGAHLNPKFKDFWRPMTPLGSSQSIEPHVLVKAFQQSSAADQQANGLNQPNKPILQRGGNRRHK